MGRQRGKYSSPLQQARQLRILRVAQSELKKHGVAGLTMKGVAEAGGVSLKTLYNVFGNRDLLLRRVATEQLNGLHNSAPVLAAEPGIPQLLAYVEGSMKLFSLNPEFSSLTIQILLRAEDDRYSPDNQVNSVLELTHAALCYATEQGELRGAIDLEALSTLLCGQQWGLVLMWEKGLLPLVQLHTPLALSHCLTLIPLCQGQRKQWLEAQVQELLTPSRPAAQAIS